MFKTVLFAAFFLQSTLFFAHSFVEVRSVNPNIIVELPYATSDNFTGGVLYPHNYCFVHIDVAERLDKVQKELEAFGFGIKMWDGYRPISLQKKIWEIMSEDKYFSNPKQGGRHTRGTAVNITLVDNYGHELSMPTPFDIFNEKAHRHYMQLSEEVIYNRTLLEVVMVKHGFIPSPTQWWHFDLNGYQQYEEYDIPLELLLKEYLGN